MSFNIRSILSMTPTDTGNANSSNSSDSQAVSNSTTANSTSCTRRSRPPLMPASSSLTPHSAPSTALGNMHATSSCGQNSRLFTNVFQSSGPLTQNDGYQFTPGPPTQVHNRFTQGSITVFNPQQWTWDPMLALQQSVTSSLRSPNFLPLSNKRLAQADIATLL